MTKYFWVVSALILVQILIGMISAHYGVEGDGFYGIPLSGILPYVSRAPGIRSLVSSGSPRPGWRQVCTSAPAVSGNELRGQRLGVNVLFVALLIVVVGSLAGEWLSVMHN